MKGRASNIVWVDGVWWNHPCAKGVGLGVESLCSIHVSRVRQRGRQSHTTGNLDIRGSNRDIVQWLEPCRHVGNTDRNRGRTTAEDVLSHCQWPMLEDECEGKQSAQSGGRAHYDMVHIRKWREQISHQSLDKLNGRGSRDGTGSAEKIPSLSEAGYEAKA